MQRYAPRPRRCRPTDWEPLAGAVAFAASKGYSITIDGAKAHTRARAKAVKQDLAKVREQQCKEAKDRYDKAIQARRIYKPSKSDTSKDTDRPDDRQYMSDDEADAYRVKARADMQEVCGNSAK